jgi:hypothetical protein
MKVLVYTGDVKVFVSWSGERSRIVAAALRDWLPDVIQGVQPWMSAADIEAGARWGRRVQEELSASAFGIICVTPENQIAPWLLFEAGALAKSVDDSLVVPYLIDLTPTQLSAGPLTQFQAKRAAKSETLEIVTALNSAMKDAALPQEKIIRAFERWWPDLESCLTRLPPPENNAEQSRTNEDMLAEILLTLREIRYDLDESGLHTVSLRASGLSGFGSATTPQLPAGYMSHDALQSVIDRVVRRLARPSTQEDEPVDKKD